MKKGDKVEILEGPFANFIATIEEYESEQSHMGFNGFNGQEDKNTNSIQIPLNNQIKLFYSNLIIQLP